MSKGNKGAVIGKQPFNMKDVEEDLEEIEQEPLPVPVQRRVNALKNIHKEHAGLEKKYRDEVAALERKYQALYAPLYIKRATIVNGEYEPTDAEVTIEGEDALPAAGDKEKDIKGIPEFWLTVLKNNSAVAETVTENDEAALAFLKDVKHSNVEGEKQGFVITFHFAENPYFSETVLTKTYHLTEDDSVYGELVFDHAEGTKISWKPGKNLTVKITKQTKGPRGGRGGRRGGGGGAARVTTVEEPCESFFRFFEPPQPPTSPEDEEDEEEAALLDDILEADFELGCIFKDKLIPHSVLWFTGEAQEFEDDFYGDDFDGFGDDDEDDDEDDDDEEEEEEEEERPKKGARGGPAPRGGAGGRGGKNLPAPSAKGAPGPQPQQPECKQQ